MAAQQLMLPIRDALVEPEAGARLDDGIKIYWSGQAFPAPAQTYGVFLAEKRSSSMHRSDQEACVWSLRSALLFLQSVAREHGANAVVNIRSIKDDHLLPPNGEQYACTAEHLSAWVRLHANIVTLP